MARTQAPTPVVDEVDDLTARMNAVNDSTEWETVTEASPTKIIFDTIGDRFIGTYQGELNIAAEMNITKDHPEGEAFDMYLFRGVDGELYSVNKSYKLMMGLDGVDIGTLCRLTYVADIPTGRGLNPMKDITLDVKRQK